MLRQRVNPKGLWHRRGIVLAACWAVNALACTAYAPPRPGSPTARLGPARQDTPWPVYLGTARHDISAAETLNADPRPIWSTTAGRAVRGGAVVAENVIVVGTVERQVVLLDRATGQILWRTRLHGTISGGPLLDMDRLFVATEASPDGGIYALQLQDGKVLWNTHTASVEAALVFTGDALYAGTETGMLLRLTPPDGKIVWRRQLTGAVRAPPVATPAGVVVATTADSLYLVDKGTGEIRSRVGLPGAVLAAPALDTTGQMLYLGTTAGHVVAVSLPELRVIWDVTAGDPVLGAPVLARDTVYALARNGVLWLIPREHPEAARSLALGVIATAGPMPLARGILAGSVTGEVVLVDPASGSVTWRVQLDGPIEQPPLVRDRELVVVAGRGDIHVYR